MSADRYEITDHEWGIRITESNGIVSEIGDTDGDTYLDDAVIGAIRQQARDLDQLRTDLAAAIAITATRDETIAELELRLRISRQSNKELRESAEQAEGRLAAIDNAPTVAYVNSLSQTAPNYLIAELLPPQDRPAIGTELIARPAKD